MKSIRSKFLVLNLISILVCSVIIGSAAVWFMSDSLSESSVEIMNLTCSEQAKKLDQELSGVRNSVDTAASLVNSNLDSWKVFDDRKELRSYLKESEELTYRIAKETNGVCTFYLRVDPELIGGEQSGFFYTKKGRNDNIRRFPITDISSYDPDDTEHVGWYYQPKAAGEPIWMEPYFNENIGVYMISYIVPLYKYGRFWGVIGMDVDFDLIIKEVKNIRPFKTGFAFLTSNTGKIYYHPEYEPGTKLGDEIPELADFTISLKTDYLKEANECYPFTEDGKKKELAYCKLFNGMELMLVADDSEIHSSRHILTWIVIIATIVLAVISSLIASLVSRRITKPLIKLTEAANEIAEGNLDVDLPEAGNDEVGQLTRSFALTVNSLKAYVAGMHTKAYRDPLTHVRNRAAFDDMMAELREQMKSDTCDYAFLMVDLNDLKKINDSYGHDRGNEYLVNSCQMICRVFRHSPVFRIGGDEFIVILQNEDLDNHDKLLAEFDRRMIASQKESDPWKVVSVAKGLAYCTVSDETPDDVFKRADEKMYQDKKNMKGENGTKDF